MNIHLHILMQLHLTSRSQVLVLAGRWLVRLVRGQDRCSRPGGNHGQGAGSKDPDPNAKESLKHVGAGTKRAGAWQRLPFKDLACEKPPPGERSHVQKHVRIKKKMNPHRERLGDTNHSDWIEVWILNSFDLELDYISPSPTYWFGIGWYWICSLGPTLVYFRITKLNEMTLPRKVQVSALELWAGLILSPYY